MNHKTEEQHVIEVLEAAASKLIATIEKNKKLSKEIIGAPVKLIELRQEVIKKIKDLRAEEIDQDWLNAGVKKEKKLINLMNQDFIAVDDKTFELEQELKAINNHVSNLKYRLKLRR